MKTAVKNSIHKLRDFFVDDNLNITKWDEALLGDFYSYNLSLCITAASMLCVISLIGLIGTYAPFLTGFIIPAINATAVYLIILGTNAFFLAALQYAQIHRKSTTKKHLRRLLVWFTGINMILASATFFTTQRDSSFFFEYILITIIIYLVPNAGTFSFFRNMVINVVSVIAVLAAAGHTIAWQDVVDIVALHVICGFVNRSRLQNYRNREQVKLSIEKQKERFYLDSRTDELTRLGNRMALRSDFVTFLDRPVCVALIDLDFFKKYNDTYGHAYGDEVLETVGNYLHQIFHEEKDHCYRYGGDEFLIISENEDIAAFRKKLEDVQKLCGTKKENIAIDCSIGYYADTAHTETELRSIIKKSDTYLYQSKAEGTGHINGGVHEANPEEDSASKESGSLAAPSASGLDPLTGLINMHTFFAVMTQWRQKQRDVQADGELAVLYFDIVNFRIVNLLYGMAYGDERLRNMGKILQSGFPEGAVSHWDVDHFVVLTDTRGLDRKAEEVIELINSTLPASTECSVGASVWKDHQLSVEALCNQARTASDENRKKVGIHFSYYTDEMGKTLDTDTYVVSHIDEAVEQGWIVPYYQPIIRALSNRICGMEALARWKDPEKGILPPADFIKPLEDARLIYKLDLSVIRQAVKQIADRYSRNLPDIPLSINLSRLDFLCCNIYQEIENLVMEYDIPRRMLHIEVTESIMTSKEDAVLKALQSFRNAGYELWMDDFGSGYSTLNLLKDYSFDLLKLDMGFLRSDSTRSRSIIGSVIEMDKKLGIRTLAEGVETEEQVQYLKKSGCEKLQGYYFGRPMPFEEALQNCLDKGIGVESAKQKICYDALGHVNFMTDIPMIISEMTGDRTHLLFANDPGLRQCRKDGFRDLAALEENLNDRGNIVSRELLAAGQHVKAANDTSEMVAFFNGKRRLLRYQLLGSYDDTRLFVTLIYDNPSEESDPEVQNQPLVSLTHFYRNLFVIGTQKMTIQSLHFVSQAVTKSDEEPVRDENGHYASVLPAVFEEDQKRYDAFLDPATLLQRLEGVECGALHGLFRTQGTDGTYAWMSHRLLLVPNAGNRQILYVIRPMDIPDSTEEALLQRGKEEIFSGETSSDSDVKAGYFDELLRHTPLPVFYKDRERRFLGASQSFLDYYGLASVDTILGKTDEDMGWHPNNEVYEEVEQEVLRTGRMYKDVSGKCISKGVSHVIYATKWPTWQNGKVSGLMGYFLDPDRVRLAKEHLKEEEADAGMASSSVSRILDDLAAYMADYQLNRRNFGVLYIQVPELVRIADNFGHDTMRSVLQACAGVIRDTINQKGSFACLGIGIFAAALTLTEDQELEEKAGRIRERIDAIREVDGIPCSLYAKVRTYKAEEFVRLNQRLAGPFDFPEMSVDETGDGKEAVLTIDGPLLNLLDQMPIGCYILKPDHTVLYWNPAAESILGFSSKEILGKKCIDMPLGCSFTSGQSIPGQYCPAAVACRTGRTYSLQMFMRKKDGSDVLVYNTLMPAKDKEGKVTKLISLFFALADKDYDASMIQSMYKAKKLTDKQIVTDANAGSVSQNPDEDAGEKPKEIKTEEQRENA